LERQARTLDFAPAGRHGGRFRQSGGSNAVEKAVFPARRESKCGAFLFTRKAEFLHPSVEIRKPDQALTWHLQAIE